MAKAIAQLPRCPHVVNHCASLHAQHGLYLAACGCFGAAQHDWAPKAMHSVYAGAGGGGALALCGLVSVSGSYKLYMIGVHVALLLQLLFIFVFAMQVPPHGRARRSCSQNSDTPVSCVWRRLTSRMACPRNRTASRCSWRWV